MVSVSQYDPLKIRGFQSVAKPHAFFVPAWLVFSGKKHSNFTDQDGLIGIVYDAAYDLHPYGVAVEPEPGQRVDGPWEMRGLRWNLPYFQPDVWDEDERVLYQGGGEAAPPAWELSWPGMQDM